MNTKNESNHLMTQYIKGELLGQEKLDFENLLEQDSALKAAYRFEMLLRDAKKCYQDESQNSHQEYYQEEEKTYTYEELIALFTPNNELNKSIKKSKFENKFFKSNKKRRKFLKKLKLTLREPVRKTKKGFKPLKSLCLKNPKNEKAIDKNCLLQFEFDKKHKFRLLLTIFDNQGNLIDIPVEDITQDKSLEKANEDIIIAKKTKKFSLLLKSLKPGIYYWRLKPKSIKKEDKYKFVTRSFYIRQDLMPKDLRNKKP